VYPPERISTYPIERRWTTAAGLRQFVRETQQGTPGGWAVVAVTQEGDPVTTTVVLTESGAPWSVFVDRSADAFSGFRGVELYACTGLDLQARDLVLSGCTGAGLTEPTTLGFASNLPLDPNYDLDEIEAQLRTWLGRPALELTLQGEQPFMNGPQPATVWIRTDAEGRICKIEQQTGTLAEIDARAQFELAPSGPALELHELRAMATRLLAAATPAADITESRWIDQSGSKDNNFVFDWRDAQGRRVQVAYTASGFLFGYLNTLAMPLRHRQQALVEVIQPRHEVGQELFARGGRGMQDQAPLGIQPAQFGDRLAVIDVNDEQLGCWLSAGPGQLRHLEHGVVPADRVEGF
jgi:hypothetical protein